MTEITSTRSEERIARDIVQKAIEFNKQPENPEGPDSSTYLMDLIVEALKDQRKVVHYHLQPNHVVDQIGDIIQITIKE